MIGICIMDICMNSIYAYAILWYAAIGNAGAMTDGLCWIWSVVVSFLVFQSYWSCQLCSVILIFPEDVLLLCWPLSSLIRWIFGFIGLCGLALFGSGYLFFLTDNITAHIPTFWCMFLDLHSCADLSTNVLSYRIVSPFIHSDSTYAIGYGRMNRVDTFDLVDVSRGSSCCGSARTHWCQIVLFPKNFFWSDRCVRWYSVLCRNWRIGISSESGVGLDGNLASIVHCVLSTSWFLAMD